MKHEPGYCDACGAIAGTAWLTIDGDELCEDCARARLAHTVATSARKPEARDDGR